MNCAKCSRNLTPVENALLRRKNDFPQYQDALVIHLAGGYGMFFDPMVSQIQQLIICGPCAEVFVDQNSWLAPQLMDWSDNDNGSPWDG